MMLSQMFYGLHPADMSCLELTIVRLELYSNLLVPHIYICRVLVCFGSHLIILRSVKRAIK